MVHEEVALTLTLNIQVVKIMNENENVIVWRGNEKRGTGSVIEIEKGYPIEDVSIKYFYYYFIISLNVNRQKLNNLTQAEKNSWLKPKFVYSFLQLSM